MNRPRDLMIIFFWAITMLLVTFADNEAILSVGIRSAVTIPLLFLLCGHSVLRVIGISAPPLEYTIYSVGTSIATTVVGGFLLNYLWLLRPFGWGVWMVAVTGTCLWIVSKRAVDTGQMIGTLPPLPKIHPWQWWVIGLATLLLVSSYSLAVFDEAKERQFVYTDLWLVAKSKNLITLGIKSEETSTGVYSLNVTACTVPDPKPYETPIAGAPAPKKPDPKGCDDHPLAEYHDITLDPSKQWDRDIFVPQNAKKVEAKLMFNDEIYRKVTYAVGD